MRFVSDVQKDSRMLVVVLVLWLTSKPSVCIWEGYWGHTMPWLLTSRAQRSYGYGPFIVQFELRGHVGFVDFDFMEWNWSYENCLHLTWNLSPFAYTWLEIHHHPLSFVRSKTTNLSFFSAITVLRLPIARATQATTAPSLENFVSHFPFLDVQLI